MKQSANNQPKQYVAPAVESFKMEDEPIMTVSGSTESYGSPVSARRGRYQYDDEE
jgi:hypothetical protein